MKGKNFKLITLIGVLLIAISSSVNAQETSSHVPPLAIINGTGSIHGKLNYWSSQSLCDVQYLDEVMGQPGFGAIDRHYISDFLNLESIDRTHGGDPFQPPTYHFLSDNIIAYDPKLYEETVEVIQGWNWPAPPAGTTPLCSRDLRIGNRFVETDSDLNNAIVTITRNLDRRNRHIIKATDIASSNDPSRGPYVQAAIAYNKILGSYVSGPTGATRESKYSLEIHYLDLDGRWVLAAQKYINAPYFESEGYDASLEVQLPYSTVVEARLNELNPMARLLIPFNIGVYDLYGVMFDIEISEFSLWTEECVPDLISGGCQ